MSGAALAPVIESLGEEMHALAERLYPLPRSLTGDGVRATLGVLAELLPGLQVHEVASGTTVFDWSVPPEWNVREAWIEGPDGTRIVDFRHSNLHLVGYSEPVRARMPLDELRDHLHSLPEHPRWIPYRTSYWTPGWGFCLPHEQLERLADGDYEVCIDASLGAGQLTYGELVLPGRSGEEVLVSTHVCHPSLANDNLSGIAVSTFLARRLADRERRFTYRFLFVPGLIGPLTWLARNEDAVQRVKHGLVLTLLGRPGGFVYKRSRRLDAEVDRAAALVLRGRGEVRDFDPWGYDERQYCSPGFDLPVGRLTRTPHGEFPEYHSSADDLSLIDGEALAGSLEVVEAVLEVLEGNGRYLNLSPKGEPQLGRRGLYAGLGGGTEGHERQLALLWVLNLSDGDHTLLDVAERSGLPFDTVRSAANSLLERELLSEQ